MNSTLIALAFISILELLLWLKPFWKIKKIYAALIIFALSIATGSYFGVTHDFWALIILVLSFYRIINLLRLIEGRTKPDYLFKVSLRSSLSLILLQTLTLLLKVIYDHTFVASGYMVYLLAGLNLLIACLLLYKTTSSISKIRAPKSKLNILSNELPTITVAIPARNETTDLEDCLDSLVNSSYPKLEILVLDDCSQNKRTPEIIRNYAHDGVVFIAGSEPPENWLAKNYAYERLNEEANGEFILFCGVDTRFDTDSLRAIVNLLVKHKLAMLSLLPSNVLRRKWSLFPYLLQPSRYAWELALPRSFLKKPPVLSTCWVINKERLDSFGGFKSVKQEVDIESHFADQILKSHSNYRFYASNAEISLFCDKSFAEQMSTAIRTRYPKVHRRPEEVFLISFSLIFTMLLPYGLLVSSLVQANISLFMLSFISIVSLSLMYYKYVRLTYDIKLVLGFVVLPLVCLYDLYILNKSMWLYEFKEVIWKGRNVCLPNMIVTPSLPKIDLK